MPPDLLVLLRPLQRRRDVAFDRRGAAPDGPRAGRTRRQPLGGGRRRAEREDDAERGEPDADGSATVGYDAGTRVKGRKRHVAVDSLGLPLALVVTGAQVQDSEPEAAGTLFVRLREATDRARERLGGRWPRLRVLFGDKNYRGSADLWAKQTGFALRRVERKDAGFEPLPKRWVVERSFGWFFNFRRLLFDLEYKVANSEGMLWLAGINVMLNRIWPRPAS